MSLEEDSQAWAWQEDYLAGDSSLALSELLSDFDLTQAEEISAESRGSGELASSSFTGNSPPLKRRRMLRYSESVGFADQQTGGFENRSGGFQMSDPGGSDSFLLCRNELSSQSLDNSSESWMAGCINEGEIPDISDDPNAPVGFDDQIDLSEFCTLLQSDVDGYTQEAEASDPPTAFPEEKQQTRTKVTYPFTLVKPCAVQGDVTLNDINQKISSTSSPLLQTQGCTRSQPLYRSTYSGKTVVACTKVHTEGNGSIIIMRTRG